ncbi:MAG: hypothetical protein ACXWIU_07215 [Limisphaerales bacterium]
MRILLILLLGAGITARGQSSSQFTITRSVITTGGGATSSSPQFQLNSTLGQPLASVRKSAQFTIQGGFWIWPAPIMFAPGSGGTNFMVSIQTQVGKTYTLQFVDSLTGLTWQSLPPITGDGTIKTVTNSALFSTQRYYRLLEQ